MRRTLTLAAAALTALALVAIPTAGRAAGNPRGLWGPTGDVPPCIADGSSPCGVPPVNDPNSVELGVRFQTSSPIYVVGVRFYRADDATWSGSLWDSNGQWITSGNDTTSGAGWQDAMFSSPQFMEPGDTFTASYFAPSGAYGFQWDYFTPPSGPGSGGYTVGPVTALGGIGANGTFVYGPGGIFPTTTFRDTNYWVTPLWIPQFTLAGFYQPVDMGDVFNTVKGGSTVPLKFEVYDSSNGTEQTDVSVVDGFEATPTQCPSGSVTTDQIEITSTGGTSLRYDTTAGQFIQNWKTPRNAGACYEVTMFTTDGSSISAKFQLK